MKYTFLYLITIILCFIVLSCQKDKIIPPSISNPCENAFDLRSKAYGSIFLGTIETGCPNLAVQTRPDKYSYSYPSSNPNNEFEFCYLRLNNENQFFFDLFKYDFCTGKATFITDNVNYFCNWSKKNWIMFSGKDGQLWKVKANGDSLTLMLDWGGEAQWSPDGSKFIAKKGQVFDENGKFIKQLPVNFTQYLWLNDNVILYNILGNDINDDFQLVKYNINTNKSEIVFTEPQFSFTYLFNGGNSNKNIFAVVEKDEGKHKVLKIDTETWKSTDLGIYNQSYNTFSFNQISDKILLRQVLIDTLTGNPCKLNYRSHIAIMNLDGTNKRQVLLPE